MKDIYQFEINSSGCNYEIWLNEIRIDIQVWNRPIVYDLPINQWIKKGVNKLEVKVIPISGKPEISPKAYCKITIDQGTLSGKIFSKLKELKKAETPSFQELKQKTPDFDLSSYTVTENFDTNFLYSNGMFNDLNVVSIQKQELVTIYKTISNYFKNKDIGSLIGLIEYKMREFSKSYQDNYNDEVERQKIYLKDLFDKKSEPVNYDEYNVRYFLKNKIVCLEDSQGNQPLFFSDEIEGSYIFYPFFFGRGSEHSNLVVVL
jgi:hypothetical protein